MNIAKMEAVANIVCALYVRHKIENFLTKNLSLDDRQLADFMPGDTQQQYGGIDESFS